MTPPVTALRRALVKGSDREAVIAFIATLLQQTGAYCKDQVRGGDSPNAVWREIARRYR